VEVATPFLTIAEIAVTLAGFTGLILVLRDRLTDQDKFRLSVILQLAMLIVTIALPSAINFYYPNQSVVWSVPLFRYGTLSLLMTGSTVNAVRGGRLSYSSRSIPYLALIPSAVVQGICVLSSFGWPIQPTAGLLSLALIWALLMLGFTFIMTLRFTWKRDGD